MGRRGTVAALAGALLAFGAGSANAVELSTPQVTNAEIKRAAAKALASGAKPQKLRAARPAWFTQKRERKLRRDADGVRMAPVDAPLPGQVGIRPGSWMISPFLCTMNFIFQNGGTLAIGTAGHCVDNSNPVLLTIAPGGSNPVLVELGRVLLKRNSGIGNDYALVEIPPALHSWVFPTLAWSAGRAACSPRTTRNRWRTTATAWASARAARRARAWASRSRAIRSASRAPTGTGTPTRSSGQG